MTIILYEFRINFGLNESFFDRLDITDALKDVYYNEIYERMDPMVKKVTYSTKYICQQEFQS